MTEPEPTSTTDKVTVPRPAAAPEAGAGPSGPGRGRTQAVRAGRAETLRFALTHTLPAFTRGISAPRPAVVSALASVNQYGWSAATFRALRARHGGAPVRIRALSGEMLVLFDPADVRQFFAEPMESLAMDAVDKVKMLGVLEPTGVICSHGALREARREVNDRALAAGRAVHPSCAEYLSVITEESAPLTRGPVLDYPRLLRAFQRISRRLVLGDLARDDEELHRWLVALREEANWLGLRKGRAPATERLYARADARIAEYAADAPAHTLIGRALAGPGTAFEGEVDRVGQAHHWLLALDLISSVAARTLRLLAAHPAEQEAVAGDSGVAEGSRLRACAQEAVRLYPVVPDFVRVTRAETTWRGVTYPAGTHVLAPMGFHQRDPEHVPGGHLFVPGRWLVPGADEDALMAPFGHGAGRCPGDQLGLLVTAAVCAEVLRGHRITGAHPALDPHKPLPGALDATAVRLTLTAR
ncbi:cytochrome P450 [Streptomyces sp. NPDC048255]|uniref:cytochrome P450 n=1 Tax=Streptomyces sp. NPDC048255 TaxID=3154713 RepID=UPI00340076C7